jgi:hypothetical protein
VRITYPTNGLTLATGSSFSILAEAVDDVAVASVELFVNGQSAQTRPSPPYEWSSTNTPDGQYSVYAVAVDTGGNTATSETVTFMVAPTGQAPTPPPSSGGPYPGGGMGSSGGGTTSSGGSAQITWEDEGCGCGAMPRNGIPWAAMALGLGGLGLFHRRSLRVAP